MNYLFLLFSIFFAIQANSAPNVLIDTDFGNDFDDVLALTLAANYHNEGKINLVGVNYSLKNGRGHKAIATILHYNDINVPIGYNNTSQGSTLSHIGDYVSELLNKYQGNTSGYRYMTSTQLYNNLSADYPDMTIITIGMQTALKHHFDIAPNTEIYSMAGNFSTGKEWNILRDPSPASYAANNFHMNYWGAEYGSVCTGHPSLFKDKNNPAYIAMAMYGACRSSWDLMPILYVADKKEWFRQRKGTMTINPTNGDHSFTYSATGNDARFVKTVSDAQLQSYLNKKLVSTSTSTPEQPTTTTGMDITPILQILLLGDDYD